MISLEARLLETVSYFNYKQTICFGLYIKRENLTAIELATYMVILFLFLELLVYWCMICRWLTDPTNFFLCT